MLGLPITGGHQPVGCWRGNEVLRSRDRPLLVSFICPPASRQRDAHRPEPRGGLGVFPSTQVSGQAPERGPASPAHGATDPNTVSFASHRARVAAPELCLFGRETATGHPQTSERGWVPIKLYSQSWRQRNWAWAGLDFLPHSHTHTKRPLRPVFLSAGWDRAQNRRGSHGARRVRTFTL